MKKLVTAAALAFAGASLSSTQALAALPYTGGDLLAGFRASAGDGSPRDYVVNLGSASQFVGGTGTIPVSNPGSLGVDLASTGGALGLFGSNWFNRSEVSWGIVGTDLGADPANTLYATRARSEAGVQAQAWLRRSNSGQSGTNSIVRAFISGYLNSDANAASTKATIQATSFSNSYAQFTAAGVDFGFFSNVESDFGAGSSGAVLDLFRITPSASGGGSQHLGHFTVNDSGNVTFTFDEVTLAPTLISPANNGQSANPVGVSFSLPETAQAGSVKLIFSSGGPSSTLTLTAANETGGAHSFNFNPANPVGGSVATGSAIADGLYTVTLSYQDSLGNAAATANASNVLIDATAPIVDAAGIPTTGYRDNNTLPDLRPQLSVTDFSSTTVVQSPAPGSALVAGSLPVTFTVTDVVGNQTIANKNLTVTAASPVTSVLAAKDALVPGAGVTGSGIAAGAKFTSLGIPSINDAGAVAYLGKWKATPSTGSGAGIFAGNPVELAITLGAPVPSIAGATFKAFKDPVINASGKIAVIATIQGGGATSANDTVVVTNAFEGGLAVVAREGVTSFDASNAVVKSFSNISLQGAEVLFTAKLQGGAPAVASSNDEIAVLGTTTGLKTVVREGQAYEATTVKSFKLLLAVGGSPDQVRSHAEGVATFVITKADGKQVLVDGDGTTLTPIVAAGQTTGGTTLPVATFKSFGIPAAEEDQVAVNATLTNNVGGVVSANAKGIFLATGSAFEPVIRLGAAVPGVTGSVFSAFSDPLLAGGAVAFPAKIKDTATKVAVDSLWLKKSAGPLTLLASKNTPPPGLAPGAQWKKFTSLGLSAGEQPAPVLYAQLLAGVGGVTAADDYGLWAVDSTGVLRLLVREGDSISGKTVKALTVLKAVPGSAGTTHSFNSAHQLVYRASFVDGTTAIVTTSIP